MYLIISCSSQYFYEIGFSSFFKRLRRTFSLIDRYNAILCIGFAEGQEMLWGGEREWQSNFVID